MTRRANLSRTKRLKIFEAAGGICHICELRIQAGQKWDVEHVRALALGGADEESNMRPAHVVCHKSKTRDDIGRKSKAVRQKMNHLGLKKRSRPIPYRLFDGTPIWPRD